MPKAIFHPGACRGSSTWFAVVLTRCFALATIAALWPTGAVAQAIPPAQARGSLPEDFLPLADLRARVIEDIKTITSRRADAQTSLGVYVNDSTLRARASATRDSLRRFARLSRDDSITLAQLTRQLSQPEAPIATQREQIKLMDDSLRVLNDLDAQIKTKISSILSPENAYRKLMSGYFAALIAVVIIGFFALAWSDQALRQQIFGGEAGLQFVTIFALLIAIILFGMTKVLEGKELSALLGGLSGYILGRSSNRSSGPATVSSPAAGAVPPGQREGPNPPI